MALLETRIAKELRHNTKRRETRIYYHRPCKAWHITSMPIAKDNENAVQRTQTEESQDLPRVQEKPNGQASIRRMDRQE